MRELPVEQVRASKLPTVCSWYKGEVPDASSNVRVRDKSDASACREYFAKFDSKLTSVADGERSDLEKFREIENSHSRGTDP
jgi:hypothetical protein